MGFTHVGAVALQQIKEVGKGGANVGRLLG